MQHPKWQRRTLLFGLLGAAARKLTALQPGRQQQESRFTSGLKRRFIETDNSGFDPVSHSFEDSGQCVVTAGAIEGPFYVDDPVLMRSDIREDREGLPLEVVLRIAEADGCTPIGGAAVDLWHCDSLGFYSRYTAYDPNVWPSGRANPSDNETFLRGRQVSDEAGMVRFQTIYPGWYTPRVQHIHARIVLDRKVAATVQLYFPEKLNRAVALRKPYSQRPPSPYNNLNDFVISQSKGGDGSWLKMTETDAGFRGSLTVGVRV